MIGFLAVSQAFITHVFFSVEENHVRMIFIYLTAHERCKSLIHPAICYVTLLYMAEKRVSDFLAESVSDDFATDFQDDSFKGV